MTKRGADLLRFYRLLGELQAVNGGLHRMAQAEAAYPWPQRGVVWFFEQGEERAHSGSGPRVVRVATHGLKPELDSTLWDRLSQDAAGSHRSSVFRTVLGAALREMMGSAAPQGWGRAAQPEEARQEAALESAVTLYAGQMPFVFLAVEDAPGPHSLRGFIERNSIALLSNYARAPLDPASSGWLGRTCGREKVAQSGLWNVQHVDGAYDPSFMDALRSLTEDMKRTEEPRVQ